MVPGVSPLASTVIAAAGHGRRQPLPAPAMGVALASTTVNAAPHPLRDIVVISGGVPGGGTTAQAGQLQTEKSC